MTSSPSARTQRAKSTPVAKKPAAKRAKRAKSTRSQKQPPYDFSVSPSELTLPGGLLFGVLKGRMAQLDHTMDEAAEQLGTNAGRLQLLRSGKRPLAGIEPELLERLAQYTGLPRGYFMIMAGIVRPEDFDFAFMDTQVDKAVAVILRDRDWGGMAPQELKNAPMALKRMVVRLYEKAAGRRLVDDLAAASADPFSAVQNLLRQSRAQLPGVTITQAPARARKTPANRQKSSRALRSVATGRS